MPTAAAGGDGASGFARFAGVARFVVSRMCFRHASHSDCFIAAVVGKCTASSERGTVEICVICGVSYRPTGDRIGA